ncbi:MAG: adenylyl-sulfate kinase [Selenomonas sp.]|nr:adenylyl-sulfate kinase [Selenomonas sp.]
MTKGKVYWIAGLSGAGKTTIGTRLFERLREEKPHVFRLDGDVGNWAYNDKVGYNHECVALAAVSVSAYGRH